MQFSVPNMSCGSCVRRVEQAILLLDANAKIEGDTVDRKVKIETTASQQDVEKALLEAGYPATAL